MPSLFADVPGLWGFLTGGLVATGLCFLGNSHNFVELVIPEFSNNTRDISSSCRMEIEVNKKELVGRSSFV